MHSLNPWRKKIKYIMETNKIKIDENGNVKINEIVINEKIFDEEKSDYRIVDREDQIDNLIDWISEAKDRPNDLYAMKEDLKYLINLKDEFLFSSISTNEFIAKSDDEKRFNEICKDILSLNENYGI